MTDQELLKELRRAKREGATHCYGAINPNLLVLRGYFSRLLRSKRWLRDHPAAGEICDRQISAVIKQLERRLARKIPLDKGG
jgi:hypothetical protein